MSDYNSLSDVHRIFETNEGQAHWDAFTKSPYLLLLPRRNQDTQQSITAVPQIQDVRNISGNAQELPSGKWVATRMAGEVTENETEDKSQFIYSGYTTVSNGTEST